MSLLYAVALLGVTGLAGVVVNDSIVMVTSLNKTALAARDVPELWSPMPLWADLIGGNKTFADLNG